MKRESLVIAAIFAFTILSSAQNTGSAAKPTDTTPPAAAAPAAPAPAPQAPAPTAAPTSAAQAPATTAAPASGQTAAPAPSPDTDQAPAAEALPKPIPGVSSATYVIGPDDSLTISVWKEPAFSGAVMVRPDGMITIPLLGDVFVMGLTPLQLQTLLESKLKKFVQDPNVTVIVVGIKSKVVYFIGEGIGKKGPMDMSPGMTILQALASGGLADDANTGKIYILRDVNGKRTRIPVHYKQALKGNTAFDILLLPNDTIVVP